MTLYEAERWPRSTRVDRGSSCCGAPVVVAGGRRDFAGDDPAACVTRWFVCKACGQPCDQGTP